MYQVFCELLIPLSTPTILYYKLVPIFVLFFNTRHGTIINRYTQKTTYTVPHIIMSHLTVYKYIAHNEERKRKIHLNSTTGKPVVGSCVQPKTFNCDYSGE